MMFNRFHSRLSSISVLVTFCLMGFGWANAQTTVKKDTLAVKGGTQTTTGKSNTNSNSSSLGSFFKTINNAGKVMSSTAKNLDKGLEEASKGITQFTKAIDGYAPDSLKQQNKSGKNILTPADRAKQKADSLKQKSLFGEIFGN